MTDAKMILGFTAVVVLGLVGATLLQSPPAPVATTFSGVQWDGDCRVASLDPLPDTLPANSSLTVTARNAAGEPVPAVVGIVRSASEWGAARVVATGQCGGAAERRIFMDPSVGVQLTTPDDTANVAAPSPREQPAA